MRQISYFAQFKDTLFDFLKQSTQTSTFDEDQPDHRTRFYQECRDKALVKRCYVSGVEVLSNWPRGLPFAVSYKSLSSTQLQSSWKSGTTPSTSASRILRLFTDLASCANPSPRTPQLRAT
jgi:hypothetical protein